MNRNDQRFIRTEENLKNALLKELETSTIEMISVSDLCREAGCSRNAFYQHHETKYELYSLVLNETIETIQNSCRPVIGHLSQADDVILEKYIHRLLDVISSRRREIASFLRSSHTFRDTLCTSMYTEMIRQDLIITGRNAVDPQTELLTLYAASGIASFIEHWLLHTDLPLPEAKQILDQCTHEIMRNTVLSLTGDDFS